MRPVLLLAVMVGAPCAFAVSYGIGRAVCQLGGLAPEYAWAWPALLLAYSILKVAVK